MINRIQPGMFRPSARVIGLILLLCGSLARAQGPDSATRYSTPEEALAGLMAAAQAKDIAALTKVFGPELKELLSGDAVQNETELESFSMRLQSGAEFEADGEDMMILNVGADKHPFPVPLVKEDGKWYFDTVEGKEEILNRRVGENELRTIRVCRGYVAAQREYFALDRDGDAVLEYAQRLASTPGKQDGLYWETKDPEPASPLGPLVAEARGEGYGKGKQKEGSGPSPYFGYLFKILTKQGSKAPGGKHDYIINDNMVAGFALVAWPVDWGNSGVMTFMVGPNGLVLEKDLGEKTAEVVAAMDAFDPDETWGVAE